MRRRSLRSPVAALIAILNQAGADGLDEHELIKNMIRLAEGSLNPLSNRIEFRPVVGRSRFADELFFGNRLQSQLEDLVAAGVIINLPDSDRWVLVAAVNQEMDRAIHDAQPKAESRLPPPPHEPPPSYDGNDGAGGEGNGGFTGVGEVLAHPVLFCVPHVDFREAVRRALGMPT